MERNDTFDYVLSIVHQNLRDFANVLIGDALPIQFLKQDTDLSIDEHPWSEEEKQKLRDLDFPAWLQRHNHERVSTLLKELIAELSQLYPDATLVGVGYCFGGKHVLRLAKTSLQVAVAFHPSFVEAEDMDGVQAPLYVGLGKRDTMVPETLASDLEGWSTTRMKKDVPFVLEVYSNVGHGFAARPDTEDKEVAWQYDKAFQSTIAFLAKHV